MPDRSLIMLTTLVVVCYWSFRSEGIARPKAAFQKLFFLQGVKFSNGVYETVEMRLFFKKNEASTLEESNMATLPGIEPDVYISHCFAKTWQ
jgi:hypothetical protein